LKHSFAAIAAAAAISVAALFAGSARAYVAAGDGGCWHNDCVPSGWCTWWNQGDQIYVINPDGTGLVQITHDNNNNMTPAWGPE